MSLSVATTSAPICGTCGERSADDPCSACGGPRALAGRYRLHDVVGRGAFGTTYRATRLEDDDVVAIKETFLRTLPGDKAMELVTREASVLRQLDHDAIARYIDDFDSGTGKSRARYLVQEFVNGESLVQEQTHRRYSEDDVLAIADELLGILEYLHSLAPPVIHRDVKPSNAIRRPDGRLVLVDFGSVRGHAPDPDLGGNTVAGTFGYMAPEQFAGDASPASDLYGIGATMAALLTRREPRELIGNEMRIEWQRHARVSPRTRALLDQLLEPDPERRLNDAHGARALVRAARDALARVDERMEAVRTEPPELRSIELAERVAWPIPHVLPPPELPARAEPAILGSPGTSFGSALARVGALAFAFWLGIVFVLPGLGAVALHLLEESTTVGWDAVRGAEPVRMTEGANVDALAADAALRECSVQYRTDHHPSRRDDRLTLSIEIHPDHGVVSVWTYWGDAKVGTVANPESCFLQAANAARLPEPVQEPTYIMVPMP